MAASEGGRLARLYEMHALEATRLALLLTGDRASAEDIVQEAFVRLFGRFRDLRQPEAFRAYLRKTVVNSARSHLRRRRVEREYLERRRKEPPPVQPDIAARHEVRQALLALPPRQRTAIVLRYYLDLTESEMADTMGCSVGTVKSLLSRGVQRLRDEYTGSR